MNSKTIAQISLFFACFCSHVVFANSELKIELKSSGQVSVPIDGGSEVERINCDFPELTDLRDIARAYSLWFGKEYLVDENVHLKVRLISPGLVTKPDALRRFHKMLAQNGLKTTEKDGGFNIMAIDR